MILTSHLAVINLTEALSLQENELIVTEYYEKKQTRTIALKTKAKLWACRTCC